MKERMEEHSDISMDPEEKRVCVEESKVNLEGAHLVNMDEKQALECALGCLHATQEEGKKPWLGRKLGKGNLFQGEEFEASKEAYWWMEILPPLETKDPRLPGDLRRKKRGTFNNLLMKVDFDVEAVNLSLMMIVILLIFIVIFFHF